MHCNPVLDITSVLMVSDMHRKIGWDFFPWTFHETLIYVCLYTLCPFVRREEHLRILLVDWGISQRSQCHYTPPTPLFFYTWGNGAGRREVPCWRTLHWSGCCQLGSSSLLAHSDGYIFLFRRGVMRLSPLMFMNVYDDRARQEPRQIY